MSRGPRPRPGGRPRRARWSRRYRLWAWWQPHGARLAERWARWAPRLRVAAVRRGGRGGGPVPGGAGAGPGRPVRDHGRRPPVADRRDRRPPGAAGHDLARHPRRARPPRPAGRGAGPRRGRAHRRQPRGGRPAGRRPGRRGAPARSSAWRSAARCWPWPGAWSGRWPPGALAGRRGRPGRRRPADGGGRRRRGGHVQRRGRGRAPLHRPADRGAPTAVGDVETIVDRFGEYRAQLSDLVGNIVTLYVAAEGLPTFEPDRRDDPAAARQRHPPQPAGLRPHREVTDQFGVDGDASTPATSPTGAPAPRS